MDRLKEAIGLGLILGAFHGAAQAVPVVPNFTQGSLTNEQKQLVKLLKLSTQWITKQVGSIQ